MIRVSLISPTGVTTRDFEDLDADLAAVWVRLHEPLAAAIRGAITVEHVEDAHP